MKYRRRRLLLLKRKHIKIIIIILAVVAVAAVIVAVTSANTARSERLHAVEALKEKGVIGIGLRGDLRELSTFNEQTREFEGLEKDLADEIVGRLFEDGIIVRFVEVNSETKDAQLRLGAVDMTLGASVNAGKSGILYTIPYYADASALLVGEGSITSSAQLHNKTVGVVQGSVADRQSEDDKEVSVLQEYLKKQNVEVTIKRYASYPEAVEGLRNGIVSAVCASESMLKKFGITGMLILPDRFLPGRYCVQIREELGAFADAVNDVIEAMKKDGTMKALIEKWNLTDYSALAD